MHICLNYYGQPRNIELMKNTFEHHIKNSDITYHLLYTTWDTEPVDEIVKHFQNVFILQYPHPDNNIFTDLINRFSMDPGNWHKTVLHYLLGLYIKSMSIKTIEEYEKNTNIKFDFIVSLRSDIYINRNFSIFYDLIAQNMNDKMVYVACDPKFDVYSQPALPDVMFMANKYVTYKMLDQLAIVEHCAVKNKNWFHPESSFFNAIEYLGFVINELPFKAFPQPL